MQWVCNIIFECYHDKETYDHRTYGNIRISIMATVQPVMDIILLCIITALLLCSACKKSPKILKKAYYAAIIGFGWSLLRQLIMLSFFIFVHVVEPISTIGIVAFGVIFTVAWSYFSTGVYKEVWNIKICCVKWLLLIIFVLIDMFVYFSINAITYFVIMVYITFLNSLPKSPADILLQLVCAFIPSLLAAGFTFGLNQWASQNKTAIEKKTSDSVQQRRDGYQSV